MVMFGFRRGRWITLAAAVVISFGFSAWHQTAAGEDDAANAERPAAAPVASSASDADNKPRELAAARIDTGGAVAAVRASNVNAVYHIRWLGNHIGSFNLKSSMSNRQYTLQATADVSVFFGSFTWKGTTSSKGLMTANGPMPQNYQFRYSTGEKKESVELRFSQRLVQDIIVNPPSRPGSRRVPITAVHLQNVVDPLSSVILLSQARAAKGPENPCNRRLPIFDGKLRYDLVLAPKGTRTIPKTGKLRGSAFVCSVRYVQVAGHKAGKEGDGDYMSGNSAMEIWMVPLPEAGLVVPYYVSVPTPAGTATMVTAKFDVETPAGRLALIN